MMGRCIAGYSNVLPLNIVSSERYSDFVDDHMETTLSGVQTSMCLVVTPRELTGFAIH
jgi:hypothetical protein